MVAGLCGSIPLSDAPPPTHRGELRSRTLCSVRLLLTQTLFAPLLLALLDCSPSTPPASPSSPPCEGSGCYCQLSPLSRTSLKFPAARLCLPAICAFLPSCLLVNPGCSPLDVSTWGSLRHVFLLSKDFFVES